MDDRSRIARVKVFGSTWSGSTADEVRYNLEDHLGNAGFTLDDAGSLITREEYFPFGETSFGSFGKKRYRFCGKERDEESGLYYYGARYYAAWTCRFVSVDPLAREYTFYTPYQYAGNKPINYIDLDGLEESDPTGKKVTTGSQQIEDAESGVTKTVSRGYSFEFQGEKMLVHAFIREEFTDSNGNINFSESFSAGVEFDRNNLDTEEKSIWNFLNSNSRSAGAINGVLNSEVRTKQYLPSLEQIKEKYPTFSAEELAKAPEEVVESRARAASAERNAVRSDMQQKLSPSGKLASERIEGGEKTFDERVAEKGGKTKDAYNRVIKGASKSNPIVNGVAKWGARVGKVFLVYGAIKSIQRIGNAYQGTSGERTGKVIAEEWGMWSGAIGGAELGATLALGLLSFFPEAGPGLVLFGAFVGGLVGGFLEGLGGKKGAGEIFENFSPSPSTQPNGIHFSL